MLAPQRRDNNITHTCLTPASLVPRRARAGAARDGRFPPVCTQHSPGTRGEIIRPSTFPARRVQNHHQCQYGYCYPYVPQGSQGYREKKSPKSHTHPYFRGVDRGGGAILKRKLGWLTLVSVQIGGSRCYSNLSLTPSCTFKGNLGNSTATHIVVVFYNWSTGGLITASTGSMSSTEPRVQAVPEVSNPEILGVQTVSAVQNLEILRVLSVYNPKTRPVLEVLQLLPSKVICSNSHSWGHL